MPQVALYAIILLLCSNIATSGLWLWNRSELVSVKDKLEVCSSANKECTNTVKIKENIKVITDEACQKQLDSLMKNNTELEKRKAELHSLLNTALDTIKNSNNVNVNKPLLEMTIDEAKEINTYLNTPVPRMVEQQLLIRKN